VNTSNDVATDVPLWLRGVWRRAWIRFADGAFDDTESVHWLQCASAMADVRVPARGALFDGVTSLAQCERSLLLHLAQSNASTGHTTVSDVVEHDDGSRSCTAEWHSYGVGLNFQPVVTFPEPGLLHVSADGTVMRERAPSGAYEEEWHLVPGTAAHQERRLLPDGRELFVAGPVAVVARDRRVAPPQLAPLPQLVGSIEQTRGTIEALLDMEFSVAERADEGTYCIVHSTLPWREGSTLDVTA
jgi:hypothetical protein